VSKPVREGSDNSELKNKQTNPKKQTRNNQEKKSLYKEGERSFCRLQNMPKALLSWRTLKVVCKQHTKKIRKLVNLKR